MRMENTKMIIQWMINSISPKIVQISMIIMRKKIHHKELWIQGINMVDIVLLR